VYAVSVAFCRRSEVLRALWQQDVPTGFRRTAHTTRTAVVSRTTITTTGIRKWNHLLALRPHLRARDEILRPLRHTARQSRPRMARAKTRRGLLSNLQDELSRRNKVLRTLRNAHYRLRHFELFSKLCRDEAMPDV
jgi:hypothetical protein